MSKPCPICRRPSQADYAPFCSRRCADVDLQRWFSGVYAVPAEEKDEPDAAASDDSLPGQAGRRPL